MISEMKEALYHAKKAVTDPNEIILNTYKINNDW